VRPWAVRIKACQPLVDALGSLAELNLEYQTKDSRTFVTDQPGAMEVLFGGTQPAKTPEFTAEVEMCATRLATLMASLHEFPTIRYKAAKAADGTGTPAMGGAAAAVATKVHRMMLSMQAGLRGIVLFCLI